MPTGSRSAHPNILLLTSDEHRADVAGYEGNAVVRTPTLDRLAARGAWFANAYCTSPVCVPSRQSFLSGKMPSEIGCRCFGDPFDSSILTFPGHLARHGYNTVAFGKMHFEDYDQLHGWTSRPVGDIGTRAGTPRYEQAAIPKGDAKAYKQRGMGFWGPKKEVRNARAVGAEEGKIGKERRMTDEVCHYIREYFGDTWYDRPHGETPLCLCLSLGNPHYPFQCEKEALDYYIRRVTPFLQGPPNDHPCHTQYAVSVGQDTTEREILRATAAYYGQVQFIDEMYARVLDAFEQVNALDDLVILYWSDHGEMLGQHGLWEKKQFYDASARVPLVIHDPRQSSEGTGGRRVDEVVSLLDLFPTLCDLAGVDVPGDLPGSSLLPLMRGEASGWRDEAVSELWSWYHQCDNRGSFMIRAGRHKFVRYHHADYPDQLFDLVADPTESVNLAQDPASAEVLARFRRRAVELYPDTERLSTQGKL